MRKSLTNRCYFLVGGEASLPAAREKLDGVD